MKSWTVFQMGDSGVLIELGTIMDPDINDKVHLLARYIKTTLSSVIDVISGYSTVLVIFQPDIESLDWDQLVQQALITTKNDQSTVRHVTIPVLYGGKYGPDLQEVGLYNNIDAETVVELHSRRYYRVYCLGFSPGFPFLGQVHAAIKTPRKATPRSRVPAGSVGIAEQQSGIYVLETPGGWQIVGRTPLSLFRPHLAQPIPYKPSDLIQFQPINESTYFEILHDKSLQVDEWPDWLWEGGIG